MGLRLQLDLPMFEESLPFRDLAAFIAHARAAGVDSDADVALKACPGTTDIPHCLEVTADAPADGARSVTVDVSLLQWAVASIDVVTTADGDARSMLPELLSLRRDLINVLLGTDTADLDEDPDGDGPAAYGDSLGQVSRFPSNPLRGT